MVCLSLHQSMHSPYIPFIHTSNIPSIHTSYGSSVVAPIWASSIQHIHTSCITSVIAPIHAAPIPSVHPTDGKFQEFPDKFPGTNYREKLLSKIMAKIPNNVTLTLHQAKLLEETPHTTNGVKYLANFLVTQKWVRFMEIYLRNYMLVVFQVMSCTMRCAHGSIAKIPMEWDPGPTYHVQRLWDPRGPTYSSRSSVPTDLDKLDKPKSYLEHIHLPALSSLLFLVAVMPNLAPNNQLGKLDHMGSFRYLPRVDQ